MELSIDDLVTIKNETITEFDERLHDKLKETVFKIIDVKESSSLQVYSLEPFLKNSINKHIEEQISFIRFSKDDLAVAK